MLKKSINKEKSLGKILVIVIFISLALMLTLCSKKTTSPDEQLSAPSNLQITLVENNKIQLSWTDNSTNETKFIIDRKKGVDNWFEKYSEVAANITTFNDIIPTNSDTVYSYRVRAFDGNNYSEYSIPTGWFADGTAPTNLQLEQIAQDSIRLTWDDNSVGELNFRVDRKIGDADWQENYKILEPDTTSYIDYNPSLYDTCYYKVFAVCGNSYSDSTQNYFIPFLPAPSNLEIEALSATSVKLTWQDNCEREDGYLIYKRLEVTDWNIINLSPDTEEWTDEDVIPGIVNYYKVCAYIGDDHSGYIEDSLNTLPAPTNFIASVIDYNIIRLDWDDNYFEEGYTIEKKRNNGDYQFLIALDQNEISFIDEITITHGIYYYKIYAIVANSQSEYSEAIANMQIWVPEDVPTIQAAINATNDGDVIIVSPGTYIENINFNGKNILLGSLFVTTGNPYYIEHTVIDGNQNGSVVKLKMVNLHQLF